MPNEKNQQLEHVPASSAAALSSAVPAPGPDTAVGGEAKEQDVAEATGAKKLSVGHDAGTALGSGQGTSGSNPDRAFHQHADSPTATKKKRKKRSRGLLAWFTARDE